ncbi:MAG TPA: hypothetical protein VFZ21_25235 [Gemmatimonadaceae bacterium]|nr:hypothetical protein [Gemmatimonadaceae bacterium]
MSMHWFPLTLSSAAVLALSPVPLTAQEPLALVPLRMEQVMSPSQLEQAGLTRLTREQRLALDAWLTRYSAELTYGDDPRTDVVLRGVSAEPPQVMQRRRPRGIVPEAPETAPIGARLVAAPDDGGVVRLADGTLWEISLPDRPTTDAWQVRDYVVVSPAPAAVGECDHVLVNTHARTRVFARFAGLVSSRRP